MQTYYLIDYENVGSDGLGDCHSLRNTDHIIIYYTEKANKIDMGKISDHGSSSLEMLEVPAGNQSCDLNIVFYLGVLTERNKDGGCNIIIVSKDKGYDNIVKFRNGKNGVKISRTPKIEVPKPEKKQTLQQPTNTAEKSKNKSNKKSDTSIDKNNIRNILIRNGFKKDDASYAVSAADSDSNPKKRKETFYKKIVKKYGEQKGREMYSCIKKYL